MKEKELKKVEEVEEDKLYEEAMKKNMSNYDTREATKFYEIK